MGSMLGLRSGYRGGRCHDDFRLHCNRRAGCPLDHGVCVGQVVLAPIAPGDDEFFLAMKQNRYQGAH
jgi:hypothetical protein